MRLISPTPAPRLNEAMGVVYALLGSCLCLSLASYHPTDPSWNVARGSVKVQNLIGPIGAFTADFCFQMLGLAAWLLPGFLLALAWQWLRSRPIDSELIKLGGGILLLMGLATALGLTLAWHPFGLVEPGGLIGMLAASALTSVLNTTGALLVTAASMILSLYLVSAFSLSMVPVWFQGPIGWFLGLMENWRLWSEARARRQAERDAENKARRTEAALAAKESRRRQRGEAKAEAPPPPGVAEPQAQAFVSEPEAEPEAPPAEEEIPIRTLEDDLPPWSTQTVAASAGYPEIRPEETARPEPLARDTPPTARQSKPKVTRFELPPTTLLKEPAGRNPYDEQELKDIAVRIKSKFQEFNVLGSVTQINPGPVVTTFEYKPEAGIKYSRITTLNDDLCLGLQAESVFIERIPGKPTVGIEVPNSKREVISLRQILESDEFSSSNSHLTIALGKDISGRIKVAAMETMPHLLIAGSTGSGKSVMLNTMIMSILYKATPNDVRMIMVDPKRVELGMYEGIPHLLTPVITDAKKATNALRNAVLEMERRLKLLASHGVRNIDQFNKKMKQLQGQQKSLFEDEPRIPEEDLRPLPYILILIDELADLMMLERANVEESVTRLAQMARAVGMHLVLATQRPSVDVITGLIKANFPARISFRVATRVDSRTILDVMGAEHLLGKGDMLFLPPGSSRLTRVHGSFVTEPEIIGVVDFWKEQAAPEYDPSYLAAPPSDDEAEDSESEEFDGAEDPMYQDAVRVVLEMGKASTSTLQRRLRLGYGRAARILDLMHRDGIIGPPDGSRPREVLKRPDWLEEVGVR